MAHFDIQNLTFGYPGEKDVLKGVNMRVERGEFIVPAAGKRRFCGI